MEFETFSDAVLWANKRTTLPANTGQYHKTYAGEYHENRGRQSIVHDLIGYEYIEPSGAVDVVYKFNLCPDCDKKMNESITVLHGNSAFTKRITYHGESVIKTNY